MASATRGSAILAARLRRRGEADVEVVDAIGQLAKRDCYVEAVRPEFGNILGDEAVIRDKWEEMKDTPFISGSQKMKNSGSRARVLKHIVSLRGTPAFKHYKGGVL